MLTLVFAIITIACVLLILVVLIQNPKGGGIAANFIAPTQIMGVKRSTDVVEKATWVLAVALISLSLLSNFFRPTEDTGGVSNESRINTEELSAPPPPQAPAPAQPQPAGEQPAGNPPAGDQPPVK